MKRYTMVFITTDDLHVSGVSFPSSGAQNFIHSIEYLSSFFLLLTAVMRELELTHDSSKKQKKDQQIPDAVYTVLSS